MSLISQLCVDNVKIHYIFKYYSKEPEGRIVKKLQSIGCLVCLAVFAIFAPAASQGLEYVNSLYWTAVYDVEVEGDYAYCCFAPGLVILDISDIANPTFTGGLFIQGDNFNIEIANHYAYIFGERDKLRIINISNPQSPQFVSEIAIDAEVDNICVDGDYIYAASGVLGLLIIDISDPYNPVIITRFDTDGDTEAVVVVDTLAFVSERHIYPTSRSFQVINVSDRYNPVLVGYISENLGWNRDLIIDGDYAYLANTYRGFIIIDISNLSNPSVLTQMENVTYPRNLFKLGDHIFMDSCFYTLQVIDVANPGSPLLISSYDIGAGATDFDLSSNYLFVAGSYGGMPILDISNVGNISQVAEYETPRASSLVFAIGDYLYAGESNIRFNIHDMTDPAMPILISRYDLPYGLYPYYISDFYLYILSGNGLGIIDISEPSQPGVPVYHANINNFFNVVVNEPFIYLTDLDAGVSVYERITQDSLVYIRSFFWPDLSFDVEVENTIGYISNFPSIYIFDFTNPADSVLLGSISPFSGPGPISVYNSFIYARSYDADENSVSIIDATDPANPFQACTISFPGSVYDIYLNDGKAYISVYRLGLYVYDISDPYNPVILGSYDTPGSINNVFSYSDFIYIADNSSLIILRLTSTAIERVAEIPGGFFIPSNYPNPFNAQTNISFSLPESQDVRLTIYDLLGRQVQVLLDEYKQAGAHTVTFDATGHASGVYFYRLRAGDRVETKRMVLLR